MSDVKSEECMDETPIVQLPPASSTQPERRYVLPSLPGEILRAASTPNGRMAVVVGAGCSVEAPTGLQLGSAYSRRAHLELVRDGVLELGDCADPDDLSSLASAVFTKSGSQRELVRRLPVNKFRMARANRGYLLAAALLREGVISAVLTLNFDLAMTSALSELDACDVSVVEGPGSIGSLGSAALIYLHRNANDAELDKWILRKEAIDEEWQGGWQQVVTQRVLSCPVVVFAGLGSPAAALTETAERIRAAIASDEHHVSVVDPFPDSRFAAALAPPAQAIVEGGWSEFMERVGKRYLESVQDLMMEACRDLCAQHGWSDDLDQVENVVARLHHIGMVEVGRLRAKWLLDPSSYLTDGRDRSLLVDLILGVSLVEKELQATAEFQADGLVRLIGKGGPVVTVRPASGGGRLRWSALEPKVSAGLTAGHDLGPELVLASGVVGGRQSVTPPDDVIEGDHDEDIVAGHTGPRIVTVDELRTLPGLLQRMAK